MACGRGGPGVYGSSDVTVIPWMHMKVMQQSLLHSINKHMWFRLPAWNLLTQEYESRAWSQLSAGHVFDMIQVLAKSRNRCKFIQVLLQCMVFTFLYISRNFTSLVIQAKAAISFKLSGNFSSLIIFYCISTAFGH